MSWLSKIKTGLKKTSSSLSSFFKKSRKLDAAALLELEEILILSDIPPATVLRLIAEIEKKGFIGTDDSMATAQRHLANRLEEIIAPQVRPLPLDPLPPAADGTKRPKVILLCGINGGGKTTTASKLAHKILANRHSVMLAACDTFRAAAVEQLEIWAQRVGAPIFRGNERQEPASVAYQAFSAAQQQGTDFLIIDTAGRLHNNHNLMEELGKFDRVLKKLDPTAPHEIILVLDGTNGQNAISQAASFTAVVPVTGFIATKLDGSSRGGFIVGVAEKLARPLYAIGVGESVEDLDAFSARDFVEALVGLDDAAGGDDDSVDVGAVAE